MIRAGILMAAATFATTVPHEAGSAQVRHVPFMVDWSFRADTPTQTQITLSPGTNLSSARVLPAQLIVVQEDLVADDGRLLVAAGTEMFGLRSSVRAACAIRQNGRALRSLVYAGTNHMCGIDRDGDGRFEHWMFFPGDDNGFPNVYGQVPGGSNRTAAPASYAIRNASESREAQQVFVRYVGARRNALRFRVCLTERGAKCWRTFSVDVSEASSRLNVMGAELEIRSRQADTVTVSVLSPISADRITIE